MHSNCPPEHLCPSGVGKSLTLLTDKPSVTKGILPQLVKSYSGWRISVYHMMLRGPLAFKWPRGASWSSYPLTADPEYCKDANHNFIAKAYSADGSLETDYAGSWMTLEKDLRGSDEIFVCVDPSPSVQSGVDILLKTLAPYRSSLEHPTILTWKGLCDEVVTAELFRALTFPSAATGLIAQGYVKRWFDYNYNVNAAAIHGRVLIAAYALCGMGKPLDPFVSKNALQLLFFLQSLNEPLTEGQIYSFMQEWRGTGRYSTDHYGRPGLGSAASRALIIDQLIRLRLLDISSAAKITVSECGRTFLSLLHPDSSDPDLPFRLAQWMNEGELARPKMNRWINTFFGKTKRKLDRHACYALGPDTEWR